MFMFMFMFMLMAAPVHANLREGLVGWWRLDEATTANAVDSSIYGKTLTTVQTAVVQNCPRGRCRNFNGTTDYLTVGNVSELSFTDNFTLSAWIYPTAYHTVGYFGLKNVIFTKETGGCVTVNYLMQVDNATTLRFIKRTGAEALISYGFGGLASLTNVWTLVTMVISGGNVSLYTNGVLRSSLAVAVISPGVNDVLAFGSFNPGVSQTETLFTGNIDDIRIYNRALSAAEVADLYSTGAVWKKAVFKNMKMNQ